MLLEGSVVIEFLGDKRVYTELDTKIVLNNILVPESL